MQDHEFTQEGSTIGANDWAVDLAARTVTTCNMVFRGAYESTEDGGVQACGDLDLRQYQPYYVQGLCPIDRWWYIGVTFVVPVSNSRKVIYFRFHDYLRQDSYYAEGGEDSLKLDLVTTSDRAREEVQGTSSAIVALVTKHNSTGKPTSVYWRFNVSRGRYGDQDWDAPINIREFPAQHVHVRELSWHNVGWVEPDGECLRILMTDIYFQPNIDHEPVALCALRGLEDKYLALLRGKIWRRRWRQMKRMKLNTFTMGYHPRCRGRSFVCELSYELVQRIGKFYWKGRV